MELKLTILYGSETGTAQDTAEQIWKNAKRYGLSCTVSALDEYGVENLTTERLAVFVVATTGNGDPPGNMTRFWRFLLRKSLPTTSLTNLRFGIIGLGDSSYERYNYAAKRLNRRLAQLGARELLPIGLADDQHDLGIDATIGPWLENFWRRLGEIGGVDLDRSSSAEDAFVERYGIVVSEASADAPRPSEDIYRAELSLKKELRIGKVLGNARTTSPDHFQDVRLLKLRSEGATYSPGDVLYARPKNSSRSVDDFFALLAEHGTDLGRASAIRLEEREIRVPTALRRERRLEEIVEQFWDLSFKPRRSTMQVLASISTDELERSKLREFATPEGQEELYNYVNRPRRTIVEVLRDFPGTARKLDARVLFEIMSPIKPRAFSVASSRELDGDEIHLLVAVVEYRTRLVEPRLGLCSNWMKNLRPGEEILFYLQKGSFEFARDKPMILVGPGTGVAPFRSLLRERIARGEDLADAALFFGCRNASKDFHCREDFEAMRRIHNLRMFCAFSRDQEEKIYVQHVIRREARLCWDFLQRGGSIYLSGSSKNMPKCVRDEFVGIARDLGRLDEVGAEAYVRKLEKEGRYQTETWG